MKEMLKEYSFNVTPIFNYIKEQAEQGGLHLHSDNSKQTVQLFLNKESFQNNEKYIGAIQYEGSNDFVKKEPHLVSWRFKRSNISNELRRDLEKITSLRRDKNMGPGVNPSAESISFKFESLNETTKETIANIMKVLKISSKE